MPSPAKRKLAKPTPIWNRKIKLDLKPLFLAVGKAGAHAVALKFDDVAIDATAAVQSLGLDVPVDELAFVLIQRALLNAMLSLTQESANHFDTTRASKEKLSKELELKLNNVEIEIEDEFIKNPAKLKLLREVVVLYAQWLCDAGIAPRAAQVISNRLPAYFVFELAREWRANAAKYEELIRVDGGPFSHAEAYENGWLTYFAFLQRRVNENVFDEPFSLQQIYVPLNASCLVSSEEAGTGQQFKKMVRRRVVDAEVELRDWLRAGNKNDALRVLSGGPGSGKSSFTRMLCSRLAEDGLAKPLYIPLHLIDPTREIVNEIERFVRDEGLLGFNPLDSERGEDGLLIVFDGLDELASQGKVAAQVTRDFVQTVERMVERRNMGQHPVFVLLSGREVVIQENETEFRKPRQILSLLPYFISEHDAHAFEDPQALLKRDLRDQWWKAYGQLTGTLHKSMPSALRKDEIGDITSQPLLNYLVALSFARGKLDFRRSIDLNSIYADLVAAVHERGYEGRRAYGPISHIKLNDFVRVLEEIALAAWHGSD
jgi:hypothetical protein